MAVQSLGDLDATSGPILVFGGPYSNQRATEAMRATAQALHIPPHRTICTGDVVAYCAEPSETLAAIRAWGCHVVAGNCEQQLASGADDCGCGFDEGTECDLLAKGWYPFAKARVSADDCQWMAGLPTRLEFTCAGISAHVLHGGASNISRFVFASDKQALVEEAEGIAADLIIGGHAGIPFMTRIPNGRGQTWFNAGVIGMPANDGTPDVWYGLITPDSGQGVRLSIHRLKYDFRPTAAAVRRWGYADSYGRALITGVWPSHDILPPAELAATGRPLRPRSMIVKPAGQATMTASQRRPAA